ncbi:hypothetical protein ACFQY3_08215 [Paenibacillus farraposensis]|uniref:hypothetical protein n=1 Tax=Paenibacillus farraposensis TaxID=2807095 RepID=UPI0036196CF6
MLQQQHPSISEEKVISFIRVLGEVQFPQERFYFFREASSAGSFLSPVFRSFVIAFIQLALILSVQLTISDPQVQFILDEGFKRYVLHSTFQLSRDSLKKTSI